MACKNVIIHYTTLLYAYVVNSIDTWLGDVMHNVCLENKSKANTNSNRWFIYVKLYQYIVYAMSYSIHYGIIIILYTIITYYTRSHYIFTRCHYIFTRCHCIWYTLITYYKLSWYRMHYYSAILCLCNNCRKPSINVNVINSNRDS